MSDDDDGKEVIGHNSITLADMVTACREEAHRIQSVQAALVAAGLQAQPSPSELRRMDTLDACANFIERFSTHFTAFKKWLRFNRGRG